jgi:hypothetical protein
MAKPLILINYFILLNYNFSPQVSSLNRRGQELLVKKKSSFLFGADPDRIGSLEKPPAVEHSFPSKSQ